MAKKPVLSTDVKVIYMDGNEVNVLHVGSRSKDRGRPPNNAVFNGHYYRVSHQDADGNWILRMKR